MRAARCVPVMVPMAASACGIVQGTRWSAHRFGSSGHDALPMTAKHFSPVALRWREATSESKMRTGFTGAGVRVYVSDFVGFSQGGIGGIPYFTFLFF